jgi:hypothetical protein
MAPCLHHIIPTTTKRVRTTRCTDLSMNESYDSPPTALATTVLPAVLSGPSDSKPTSTVAASNSNTGSADDCEDDSPLQHLFGDPTVHGEKEVVNNKRKQQLVHGRLAGDRPLVSMKRVATRGLVQTTMLQFLHGSRKRAKMVACNDSLTPSLLFSSCSNHGDDLDALADLCAGFWSGVDGDKIPPHYCTF